MDAFWALTVLHRLVGGKKLFPPRAICKGSLGSNSSLHKCTRAAIIESSFRN